MSARFKVGDEVLVRATVSCIENDATIRVKMHRDPKELHQWLLPAQVLEIATTRAPWDVLREAADVLAKQGSHIDGGRAFDCCLKLAQELEREARPPSLLEAAKALVAEVNSTSLKHLRRSTLDASMALEDAIAAAEKEAGQ